MIQIVASSAEEAIKSRDEKLSPYMIEKVQSNEELLGGTVGDVDDGTLEADPTGPIGD